MLALTSGTDLAAPTAVADLNPGDRVRVRPPAAVEWVTYTVTVARPVQSDVWHLRLTAAAETLDYLLPGATRVPKED